MTDTIPLTHSRRHTYLLALILLVALVARFRYLTEIEHNIDHAYPVWQALNTLEHGTLPLKGQGTSVLFANPPLTGYLFIPAVALTRSPLGVYVFVIALNTLGVFLAYRATRTLIGPTLALLAAALLAVNPWMIEYSRTSWVQSLLPFFVPALAWLLWPVLLGKARHPGRRTLLALVVMTMLAQTYLLAYFIAAPVAILLLIFRRRIPWRSAAAGTAIFLLATLVYGAGLLQDTDDLNRRIDNFTATDAHITHEAWDSAVRLVSGAEYEVARGVLAPADDSALRHDWSRIAHYVILAAVLIGISAAMLAVIRGGPRRDAAIIALVWFGLPILVMSYTGAPVHPFYQLLGIPAGHVLAAWGFGVVVQPQRSRFGAWLLVIAFVPFAALMLLNSARYYQETAAIPGAHGLSALPLDAGLQLGRAINQHRQPNQPVFADEEAWILNSFAGDVFDVVRDVRAPALTILPPEGALYITLGEDAPLSSEKVEALQLADGTTISLYSLPPADEFTIEGTQLNVPTQQGMTLLGYELDNIANQWTLRTVWRIDSVAPDVLSHIFAPFIHLFDAEGNRVTVIDGEGLRGDTWRPGQVHVHEMTFTLPPDAPGPFTLRIGQFDGLTGTNLIFLPEDGDPSVAVTLPDAVE